MRPSHALLVPVALLGLAACGADPAARSDNILATLAAGASQTTVAGSAVPIPPAVQVFRAGEPLAGVTITFEVTRGGGSVSDATVTTDADGIARVGAWVLGTIGPQELVASLPGALGSPVRISALAVAGVPAIVELVQGDGQEARVYASVPNRPIVRVLDAAGRPLAGIPVTWDVAAGDAAGVRGADVVTLPDGTAGLSKWIMIRPGQNVLTATAAGITVTFRATGT